MKTTILFLMASLLLVLSSKLGATSGPTTIQTSAICGVIWSDADGDGIREVNETFLGNQRLVLRDQNGVEVMTVSSSDQENNLGSYCFENIDTGTYYIEVQPTMELIASRAAASGDPETQSSITEQNGPLTTDLIVISGDNISNINAGLYQGAEVNGIVWQDDESNIDGLFDPAFDELISDVNVILLDDNANQIAEAVTDDDGYYTFGSLKIGSYRVMFMIGESFAFAPARQGDDDSINSSVTDLFTGKTDVFNLTVADKYTANAGLRFRSLSSNLVAFKGSWQRSLNGNQLLWKVDQSKNIESIAVLRAFGESEQLQVIDKMKFQPQNLEFTYLDDDIVESGVYYYQLQQKTINGVIFTSPIIDVEVALNTGFSAITFPNPTGDQVMVRVSLDKDQSVSYDLFDFTGKKVKVWKEQEMTAGSHNTLISMSDLPGGKYLLQINIGQETLKQVLVRL